MKTARPRPDVKIRFRDGAWTILFVPTEATFAITWPRPSWGIALINANAIARRRAERRKLLAEQAEHVAQLLARTAVSA